MSAVAGLNTGADGVTRCFWCGDLEDYIHYHDTEWGMPVDDDHRLFEKLCLEGFQSGLSWITILRKRDNFRRAFDGFDPARVAAFPQSRVETLLEDASIIRHRGKIEATLKNARAALAIIQEFGSLAAYIWRFEPKPENRPTPITLDTLRAHTTSPESKALAKDLKKRGFSFVGPTTCYAFMQSMGIVNDHIEGCSSRARVEAARDAFQRPTS